MRPAPRPGRALERTGLLAMALGPAACLASAHHECGPLLGDGLLGLGTALFVLGGALVVSARLDHLW